MPRRPVLNETVLQNFLEKRPLVSLTEIGHAFGLSDNQSVKARLNKIPTVWRRIDDEFLAWVKN
ncbi:hypothetical protein EGK75_11875 [Neisseria weixii]|uniref:Uncharacterized protein n=1 Tax=Neisseria weixii TaxID=1853276 RepID=A0A3N4MK69_9NEIS|nr:hypothetical protein EGK74_11625 [Neisseria weixii]RPD84324.1 hypothetical protein EGK75_11875 [Neisseria weixii]